MYHEILLILLSGLSVLGIAFLAESIVCLIAGKEKTEKAVFLFPKHPEEKVAEEALAVRRKLGECTVYICCPEKEKKEWEQKEYFLERELSFCTADDIKDVLQRYFGLQTEKDTI